ncbi:hypothetical protein D3C78_1606610 [compost metagenome]
MSIFFTLRLRPFYRNNNVTEHICQVVEFFILLNLINDVEFLIQRFIHRKGEYICRAVNSPIFTVQNMNLFVIHKSKSNLALFDAL